MSSLTEPRPNPASDPSRRNGDSLPRGFDHAEILAYVEGDLTPRRRARLERRLARSDEVRAFVDRLAADRELMRSLPNPDLPRDFIAEMESVLARPMLIEYQPGAFRRQHRRRVAGRLMLRRLGAVAAAAVLVGAVGLGGLWSWRLLGPDDSTHRVQNDGLDGRRRWDPSTVVAQDDASSGAVDVVEPAWPPVGATIHHGRPGSGPVRVAATPTLPDASARGVEAGATEAHVATFALLIPATDFGAGEADLRAAVEAMHAPDRVVSLVRNFEAREARALLETHIDRLLRGGHEDLPNAIAGLDGARHADPTDERAWRRAVASAMHDLRRGAADPAEADGLEDAFAGRHLLGDEAAAADYGEQLRLSNAGATHTVTLTADQLDALLMRLHLVATTRFVSLETLDGDSEAGPSLEQRLRELADFRTAISEMDGHETIHLPIRVETSRTE